RLVHGRGHQFLQRVYHHGDTAVLVVELFCGDESAAVAHIPLDLGGQNTGQMGAAAHHAELCLRCAEEGPLHGDRDIRTGGVAHAAAQAVAVNCTDQGNPQFIEGLSTIVIDLLGIGDILIQDALIESLDVHAHAEGFDVGVHNAHPDVVLMVDIVAQEQDLLL
ncbi:RNA polymerase sigma factor sigV, partial [Dysosmobacter welbionis]